MIDDVCAYAGHRPRQLYFTLSNNNTDPAYTDQRNVLVLCVSKDLNTWTILRTLLADDTGLAPTDSVRYTGFHYVDWQFDGADGEDIIYAVSFILLRFTRVYRKMTGRVG